MPTPTPVPEVCARTAKVAGLVQAARQVRDPAPRAVDAGPQLPPLVLVVDDARTVRVKIGRVLQAQGLRLAFAVDGEDALRQLAGQCPDLLITDMDMPGLDGLGLTRALRKLPATAELPVIMVSAADDRLRAEAAAAGVTALLGKPFGDAHLVELAQSLLADPLARAADGQLRVTEPA